MKNLLFLSWLTCVFSFETFSQPSSDFNSGIGNWTTVNGYSTLSNTNTLDGTTCASFYNSTVPPNAALRNPVDFNSLGKLYKGNCLSFDYMIGTDGIPGTVTVHPRIYLEDGIDTIWWESTISVAEMPTGPGWVKARAIIEIAVSPTSPLPSNADGGWHMSPGMTNIDFNRVMMNNRSIFFLSLGRSGFTQNGTQEDLRVDNVRVQTCAKTNPDPCSTFDGSHPQGNWVNTSCGLSFANGGPTSTSGNCATLTDNPGASWFTNATDYNNLGATQLNRCLCFDYYVENDGVSGASPNIYPTIYLFLGSQWIAFQSSTAITEGTQWIHVCAPIELTTSSSLTLPSNTDGQWIMDPAMTFTDFNNVLLGNTSIGFAVDVMGSTAQTEDIRIDNVCIVDCSKPTPCNSNFEFNFTTSTDPAAVSHHNGNISIPALNPTSTYRVDWGDGSVTMLPPPHLASLTHHYLPGSYFVCLTETMSDRKRCMNCLSICVPKDAPNGSFIEKANPPTSLNKIAINHMSRELREKLMNEQANDISIHPNPVNESAFVSFKLQKAETVAIQVSDMFGKTVLSSRETRYEAGNNKAEVYTGNLTPGVYIIKITIGKTTRSEKISVVR